MQFCCSILVLGVSIAPAFPDAAWDACLKAPKRACVFDEALRTAQTVNDDSCRVGALVTIATDESRAGLADASAANRRLALQAAQSVKNESHRAGGAGARRIRGWSGRRVFRMRCKSPQSIKGDRDRSNALAAAAVAQKKAGLVKEAAEAFATAIASARLVEPETTRLWTLLG